MISFSELRSNSFGVTGFFIMLLFKTGFDNSDMVIFCVVGIGVFRRGHNLSTIQELQR
jgi:hypothetical protein